MLLICAVFLIRQLGPQGARGQPIPIAGMVLLAISYLSLTSWSEELFAPLRMNSAFLLSHICSRTAIVLVTLYFRYYLAAEPPTRRYVARNSAAYGAVALLMVYLFLTAPQQPHGAGFGWGYEDSPRMRLFWIVQSLAMLHAMAALARVVARACAQERRWRRVLLAILLAVAVVFGTHEAAVIVVALVWPTLPPLWMQYLTLALQITTNLLLVAGTIAPAVFGTYRGSRVARSYLDRLTPLHHWLIQRYPQVCFRSRVSGRAETRITDMLIEISDALRLLQYDAPELAEAYRLGDETIRASARESPHHAAYELAAAELFRTHDAHNLLPYRPPLSLTRVAAVDENA